MPAGREGATGRGETRKNQLFLATYSLAATCAQAYTPKMKGGCSRYLHPSLRNNHKLAPGTESEGSPMAHLTPLPQTMPQPRDKRQPSSRRPDRPWTASGNVCGALESLTCGFRPRERRRQTSCPCPHTSPPLSLSQTLPAPWPAPARPAI